MNSHRELFEIPTGIYALSHSVGPCVKKAQSAMHEQYFKPWYENGGDAWPGWLAQVNEFSNNIGKIINASADEICPQPNLASGFYSYLTAICKLACKQENRKKVIVMHKDAFASMGFVVKGLEGTFNVKLVLIDAPPNDLNAWENALQQNNVLACLFTHVHSNTSLKSDIKSLVTLCKRYHTFALVDIAQSIGVVDINVKQWGVDAAFGSCVKWLCGGPGAGFMYVTQTSVKQLDPDPIGWFSHENPFEFDIEHFKYADTALRFWGGTPSVAPYVTANAAITTILDIGIENVVTHNLILKCKLLSNLEAKQHNNPTADSADNLGGSLCIKPNCMTSSVENLKALGVLFDCRGEVIRISLHIFNTEEEAVRIAECF